MKTIADTDGNVESERTYTYDANGDLLSISIDSDNDGSYDSISEYEYNDKSQYIGFTYKSKDEEEKLETVYTKTFERTYNDDGNLTKIVENKDGELQSTTDFEYSKSGDYYGVFVKAYSSTNMITEVNFFLFDSTDDYQSCLFTSAIEAICDLRIAYHVTSEIIYYDARTYDSYKNETQTLSYYDETPESMVPSLDLSLDSLLALFTNYTSFPVKGEVTTTYTYEEDSDKILKKNVNTVFTTTYSDGVDTALDSEDGDSTDADETSASVQTQIEIYWYLIYDIVNDAYFVLADEDGNNISDEVDAILAGGVEGIAGSAEETCDGKDNDGDEEIDEGVMTTYYDDDDHDGYGDPAVTSEACSKPTGYVENALDCDDTDREVTTAEETIWYLDDDGDGEGDETSTKTGCEAPEGYVDNADDCDDTNPNVYKDNEEVCDGIDNDCDDRIDEYFTERTYYADSDEDGYGDPASTIDYCEQPDGYVTDNTDCDDDNANIHPGHGEVCADGVDSNCEDGDTETFSDGECTMRYAPFGI